MKIIHKYLLPAIMLSLISTTGCSTILSLLKNEPSAEEQAKKKADEEQAKKKANEERIYDCCLHYQNYNELHCAIVLADSDKVKKALASGANINAETKNGETPISLALSATNILTWNIWYNTCEPKYPKDLVVNGDYVKYPDDIRIDIVKQLIESGANVNNITYRFENNSQHITEYDFNDSYIDVNASMNTPLLIAIRSGKSNIVKQLLNAGADINTVSKFSVYKLNGSFRRCSVDTPLSIVLKETNGNVETVKLLLDAGADANILLDTDGNTPFYIAAENASRNENYQRILREFLVRSNETEISKQVDLCIGNKPTHEQAEWLATNIIDRNKDIDAYKRTKGYVDSVESIYRTMNNIDYAERRRICSVAIASTHDVSEQLPYIYDYCNGDSAAFAGGICQDTPKEVLEGIRKDCPFIQGEYSGSAYDRLPENIIENFAKCIQKFQIVKDDYVTSSEFFSGRIQKVMDDNAKQTKAIRENSKKAEEKNYQNFIYWNSPRGKCETRCNNEYKKNTDLWNSCMSICKDKRSDVLE